MGLAMGSVSRSGSESGMGLVTAMELTVASRFGVKVETSVLVAVL